MYLYLGLLKCLQVAYMKVLCYKQTASSYSCSSLVYLFFLLLEKHRSISHYKLHYFFPYSSLSPFFTSIWICILCDVVDFFNQVFLFFHSIALNYGAAVTLCTHGFLSDHASFGALTVLPTNYHVLHWLLFLLLSQASS